MYWESSMKKIPLVSSLFLLGRVSFAGMEDGSDSVMLNATCAQQQKPTITDFYENPLEVTCLESFPPTLSPQNLLDNFLVTKDGQPSHSIPLTLETLDAMYPGYMFVHGSRFQEVHAVYLGPEKGFASKAQLVDAKNQNLMGYLDALVKRDPGKSFVRTTNVTIDGDGSQRVNYTMGDSKQNILITLTAQWFPEGNDMLKAQYTLVNLEKKNVDEIVNHIQGPNKAAVQNKPGKKRKRAN